MLWLRRVAGASTSQTYNARLGGIQLGLAAENVDQLGANVGAIVQLDSGRGKDRQQGQEAQQPIVVVHFSPRQPC